MPTSTDSDPLTTSPGDRHGATRWQRVLVALGGVLALLLLGAAAGLLIGLPSAEPAAPTAGSVDVGFAQDMSVHHEQAVQMASWERDHSGDPVLRQLAFDIEATQTAQIGRMQGWLELWGASALPVGGQHMAWMSGTSGHSHAATTSAGEGVATMPGMASAEELRALRAASGRDLDVLFLQLMLRHHQGGAAMLEYGAQHAEQPVVRNLATQMLSSQSAESTYLMQLLTQRGGQPLPL
ncbi:DUF305 domain-containing protein [Pseudonocardia bannensis]|uniref:DUF305 domain-containing protein n=1 Tax=Pseudonocardia bannensis TaxID=630973 RepID=A0A848DHG5_9PSEU|nr:DUF305 domain-containing protein [Pseudonocardia bannensis]NMH92120.1 DUF305 domain-containing protein [Pseudonocardia bannensis]